jgi:hypothetical protein
MFREPYPEERTVRFLKWRIPHGNFKPWGRLLVMLAMIAAVGSAARSLGRRIQDARVRERLDSFLEAEERATSHWRPLVALHGAPHTEHPEAAVPPPYGCALEGRVVDVTGRPVARARLIAGSTEGFSDREGNIRLAGLSPRLPERVLLVPPDDRTDLAPVSVHQPGPGFPGQAVSLGIVHFPPRGAPQNMNIPPTAPPRASLVFRTRSLSPNLDSLADWDPVSDRSEPFEPGETRRELFIRDGKASLGPPQRSPNDARQPLDAAATTVHGTMRFDEGTPRGACVFVDLFNSGVAQAGTVALREGAHEADFELNALPPGEHRLVAFAPGWIPVCEDFVVPLPSGAPAFSLRLERGADVDVLVESAGSIAPGSAVRVTATNFRKCQFSVPPSGRLELRGLPAEMLKFELLLPAAPPATAVLAAPPLEHAGEPIVRTLSPGSGNMKVTIQAPPAAKTIACRGAWEPAAWIYRAGARLDEPSTWTRADATGRFEIIAIPGSRLFAARGDLPELFPQAAAVAAEEVRFEPGATVEIEAEPSTEVELTLGGPQAFGRAVRSVPAGQDGVARFEQLPSGADFLAIGRWRGGDYELASTVPDPGKVIRLQMKPNPVY